MHGSYPCFTWDSNKYPNLSKWKRTFPTFRFVLNGDKFYRFEPEAYLTIKNTYATNRDYCIGIRELAGRFILGGNFMSRHDIFFDLEKKSVSWIPSNCNPRSHKTKNTKNPPRKQPNSNPSDINSQNNTKKAKNDSLNTHK